jgi:hypothetical protein
MNKSARAVPPHHAAGHNVNPRDYLPLVTLIAVSALAAAALALGSHPATSSGATPWMHLFMGLFLVIFALLKLFDLPAFADGFQKYDLLARPARPYALAYPFIELALGLGYLAAWQPALIYVVTVLVLGFGALGVVRALQKGLDLTCTCMGTILQVPLSTVALTEHLGMAAMAAVMWLQLPCHPRRPRFP